MEKLLLAVVYFLKQFKQYLLGRRFTIRTDHAALTWLRKTPEPIGQNARWLEQMEEYDFQIIHRPGAQHGNADALSRRPCELKGCVCSQVTPSDAELSIEPLRELNALASPFVSSFGAKTYDVLEPATSSSSDVERRVYALHQRDVSDKEDTRGDDHGAVGVGDTGVDESSAVVVEDTRGDVGDQGDPGAAAEPSIEGLQWTHDELKRAQRADKELALSLIHI